MRPSLYSSQLVQNAKKSDIAPRYVCVIVVVSGDIEDAGTDLESEMSSVCMAQTSQD